MPDNFTVDELPKNIAMIKSDSTVMFKRLTAVQGNMLQCLIQVQFLESYFTKEEYPDLRDFYKKMYELLNQPVVFRKKS